MFKSVHEGCLGIYSEVRDLKKEGAIKKDEGGKIIKMDVYA